MRNDRFGQGAMQAGDWDDEWLGNEALQKVRGAHCVWIPRC